MPKIYLTPSFLESLSKLSKNNHHRANQTILKMMADINLSGLRFHKVHDFTSISSGMDLRIICNPWKDGYVINYVDHHDAAYLWAKNHTLICNQADSFLEFLPHTEGQVVAQKTTAQTPVKSDYGTTIVDRLSGQGIPELLLRKLQSIDSENALLETIQDFSPHLQEIILNAATGATTDQIAMEGTSRVVVINDDEELERALKYPLDHWRLFLHPMQADIINQDYLKKIAIVGGPGTGKTIVLVHRAVKLYKENKKVLLITKTRQLAEMLLELINKLISNHNIIVAYFPCFGNELPDYWLQGNQLVQHKKNSSPPYKLRFFLKEDSKIGTKVYNIEHVLFDEVQDLYDSLELSWLEKLLKNKNIGTTMSIDINQMIYTPYHHVLNVLFDSPVKIANLTYSYRSTQEILKYAKRLSRKAKDIHKKFISEFVAGEFIRLKKDIPETAKNRIQQCKEKFTGLTVGIENVKTMFKAMPSFSNYPVFYGLTGIPVKVKTCSELDLIELLNKTIAEIAASYKKEDICVLVPNENIAEMLKKNIKNIEVINFKSSKGHEWFAGIVLIDAYTLNALENSNPNSFVTLDTANAIYVAITRFREKIIIISVKDSVQFKPEFERRAEPYTKKGEQG